MSDYFLIARIESVFNKDGFVKISSFSDFPERFYELSEVFVDFFGTMKKLYIASIEQRKNYFVLKFKGFDSTRDTEVLIGKEIYVEEKKAVELPEGTYFIHDIIGSSVYRNNGFFGTIKDVLIMPANDVYVIEDRNKNEILIPVVLEFIESFDPAEKKLILKPGDDFYEQDED